MINRGYPKTQEQYKTCLHVLRKLGQLIYMLWMNHLHYVLVEQWSIYL